MAKRKIRRRGYLADLSAGFRPVTKAVRRRALRSTRARNLWQYGPGYPKRRR